jgi:tetratricopeptide (TPR) repeat protein
MKSNPKLFKKRAGITKPAQLMVAGTLFFLLSYTFLGPNPLSYNVCIKLMTFCKQNYNYGDAAKIGEYFLSTTKILPGLRDLEKAEIELVLGEVYLEQENFTRARALFMEVLSIANKQTLINKRLKVRALVKLADIAGQTQHYEESKGLLEEALAILEKVPEQKLTFAQTKVYLATIYMTQGNLEESDEFTKRSACDYEQPKGV